MRDDDRLNSPPAPHLPDGGYPLLPLRTLEADGIIHREVTGSVPPRVDYSLTERGTALVARLLPLMEWIVDIADEIVAAPRAPRS